MLRIQVLGEFRVETDGLSLGESGWPRRDVKRLLQLLAVRHAHRFSREAVAECLWPGVASDAARNRLYNIVYLLRGVLEPQRPARAASSYVHCCNEALQLGPAAALWIDADAFEQLLDAAVAAEPAAAQGLLEQAVALYRGPLLGSTVEEDWAGADRTHLEQRFRGALRNLAQLYRTQSHAEAVIGTLQRLVRIDLTDEAVQRELIQALADAGRLAEALAQYRLCKEVLASELGVAPSPQTMALAQRLKALGTAAGAFAPRPAPAESARPRHQLPHVLGSLIGRDAELATLRALCERIDTRLLTVTGVGGVGKTQLALRLGTELQGRFEHGVAFVSLAALAPQSQPHRVAGTVAHALGLTQSHTGCPQQLLREYLADKHLLLVLDNLEHLLPAAAPLLGRWLTQAPQLMLLATSRTPLHVQGERLLTLGPLALPGAHTPADDAASLARVPAIALFVQRAAAIDASFALDAHNASAISTICTQLDGLPLAIELAAARIRLFSPADLLARLDRRFALLSHGLLDSPQRHRSLAAVLDWSHALLSPAAGQLLAALSVFRGGATLVAIHGLFSELDPCLDDVLSSLLDHHLVSAHTDTQGNRRFTMLETVRIYAAQRLADSGQTADVARAHAVHFTGMAEDMGAGLRGPQQTVLLDRLQAEHDNLRTALQWSTTNDATLAHRLSAALSEFWLARGHLIEAGGCMDQVLALPNDRVPTACRAKALQTASRVMWRLGEFSKADALLMQVLALGRDLDDPLIICRALNGLAGTRDAMGHPEDAVALLHEALSQAQRSGSGFVVAAVLMNLGHTLISLGEHARAQTFIEQSRTYQQALDDACGHCHWLMISGHLARTTGDAERAQVCYEESLQLARSSCNRPLIATALSNLGQLAADRNALPEAAALIDQCLTITRAHGLRGTAARALICRARLALSQGHLQQADDALAQGLALYGPACNEVEALYGHALRVRCAVEQGTMQRAGKQLGALLAMPSTRLFGVRAALVAEAGALVAIGDDTPALAIRALAAASAARHRAGTPLYDSDRVFQEQVLDVLRANVGLRKFEVLWTNGQRGTVEALLGELNGQYGEARVPDLVET